MIVDDQRELVALLGDPATHGIDGPVETIETHISRIFLAGNRAFKTKRAVKLPYVDFSTPQLRCKACEREVELNRATAPGLYLGVRRITRSADGRLRLDGDGELADCAVEMSRFDQECLFDRMADAGKLTPRLMTETTRAIVRFHGDAPIVTRSGGAANMAAVLDINEAGFATSRVFGGGELDEFNAAFRAALARHASALDERAASGKVRRCHGDLHLRNLCLIDGKPCLFDCIEFNDRIATTDTLYDLAFLLMDLWHRGFVELANLVANRYLDDSGDEDGFGLLAFFMAVRAAVRAHVLATQSDGGGDRGGLAGEARSYFMLARRLLGNVPSRLIAVGGFSGSGKSTVAEALAPHIGAAPGARIVESDRVRKAMHGVAPETRLPKQAYRPEVSARVYGEMAERAGAILAQGGSVVTDAVFDRPQTRIDIETAATAAGSAFAGFWLSADPVLLRQRVAGRGDSVSDATDDVLSLQLARADSHGGEPTEWTILDAGRPPERIVEEILRHCGLRGLCGKAGTLAPG